MSRYYNYVLILYSNFWKVSEVDIKNMFNMLIGKDNCNKNNKDIQQFSNNEKPLTNKINTYSNNITKKIQVPFSSDNMPTPEEFVKFIVNKVDNEK